MTRNINIYKVDWLKFIKLNGDDVLSKIVSLINGNLSDKGFDKRIEERDVVSYEKGTIEYYNYVDTSIEVDSDWKEFLPGNLLGSFSFRDRITTVLLFIYNDPHLYITIGGNGYSYIKSIIDHRFGLILLSKVVDDINDELISVNSRGMIGTMAAIQEQFRRNLKIIDYVKFGKIPLEVNVKLNAGTSNLYFDYLQNKSTDRIKVKAGRYFKIKKAIDYEQFHDVILNLNHIMELDEQDSFSTFQRIGRNEDIIHNLNDALILNLFQSLDSASGQNKNAISYIQFDFDICHHRLVQEFYEADDYIIEDKASSNSYNIIGTTQDRENIYTIIKNRIIQIGYNTDYFQFRKYIYGIKITAATEGVVKTKGSLIQHISTEVRLSGSSIPYFHLDSQWFKLDATYRDTLAENCWNQIVSNTISANHRIQSWNRELMTKEKEYNIQFSNRGDFLVLDTITPDGVELCDFLKVTDDNLYLYHVKGGFDAKMRELCNQIVLASRVLSDDLLTGQRKYLKELHRRYANKEFVNSKYKVQSEFLSLFDGSKNITMVMTIGIGNNEDKQEVQIKKSNSNIAKFSVMNCNYQMKAYNFDFKVCLI